VTACTTMTNTVNVDPPGGVTDPGEGNDSDFAVNEPRCIFVPLVLKQYAGP